MSKMHTQSEPEPLESDEKRGSCEPVPTFLRWLRDEAAPFSAQILLLFMQGPARPRRAF